MLLCGSQSGGSIVFGGLSGLNFEICFVCSCVFSCPDELLNEEMFQLLLATADPAGETNDDTATVIIQSPGEQFTCGRFRSRSKGTST